MLFAKHHEPPPWLYPAPAPDAMDLEARRLSDEVMLDALQQQAFSYFIQHTDAHTGLVADSSRDEAPSSIASVGFALSGYPIAVERGWISRDEAVARILRVMRFLGDCDQSGNDRSSGHRGFYFHFLHMKTGERVWQSELSMIDSAILFAGLLTAAAYFDSPVLAELELRDRAEALYRRVDWNWAQNGNSTLPLGWKPGHGFLSYAWMGYSEALILYVLGLASPTHPLAPESFEAWTETYQWENIYGYDVLYAGPLFIHQLSHVWLDLRGIQDAFMREKRIDYFENSRRATYVHREYATRNPLGFKDYSDDCWGLSAGSGPSGPPIEIEGRLQHFFSYAARGAPYGPDDGTIAGSAAIGSIAFAPEIVLPTVRKLVGMAGETLGRRVLASGFNSTVVDAAGAPWVADVQVGFDLGLILTMIENYRSGLLWRLWRKSSVVRKGLARAGFTGGWLGRHSA